MASVIAKSVMFEAVSSEPGARETRNTNISFYPGHVIPVSSQGAMENHIYTTG